MAELLHFAYHHHPSFVFMTDDDGTERFINDVYIQSMDIARSLVYSDLKDVILFTENTPRQVIVLLGTMIMGGRVSMVYHNSSQKTCAHIVEQTRSKIAFVDSYERYEMMSRLVDRVVLLHDEASWTDFSALGRCGPFPGAPEPHVPKTRLKDCCVIIYTSGTTGLPKGVMLSHDNIMFSANAHIENNPVLLSEPMRVVSHLPMSHIGALMNDVFVPLTCICEGQRATLFFSKETLTDTLPRVRPTMLFCVPRIWEKLANDAKCIDRALDSITHRIMKQMCTTGHRNRQIGGYSYLKRIDVFARLYMRSHILKELGLDKVKLPLTGGACTSTHLLDYFGSIGLDILGAYGMSELMGVQTVSRPDFFIDGYAGIPVPGTEVRVHETTGELWFRGRQVTQGYINRGPCVDGDGWFHTGDLGEIHASGHIKILGRVDDTIVTSTGNKIIPEPIESRLLKECGDDLDRAVIVGHGEKYICALLALKRGGDVSKVLKGVDSYNSMYAASRTEKIRRVSLIILGRDDVTPTNKIKRSTVLNRYSDSIKAMYYDVNGPR